MAERGLTPKQARFAEEYLVDLNGKQAAIRAGCSPRSAEVTASKWLRLAKVRAAVTALQQQRAERTGITQDWVLETIFETAERCKQAVPVLDAKGEPVLVETPNGDMAPAYTFQPAAVLRAAELGGKHLGLFTEKRDVSVNHKGEVATDPAVARLLARIEERLGPGVEEQPVEARDGRQSLH